MNDKRYEEKEFLKVIVKGGIGNRESSLLWKSTFRGIDGRFHRRFRLNEGHIKKVLGVGRLYIS